MDHPYFDWFGLILTAAVAVGSFFLFGAYSNDWSGSLFAGILAAGLFWVTYTIIRWLVLALKK